MKSKLSLKNIEKEFGNSKILSNISFNVNPGEFLSVLGPSGCGKTTLLYLIQGFLEKTKGTIEVNGEKGFVFQDHNLFPWKKVKENVSLGLINQGKNEEEIESITSSILNDVGLSEFRDHYPHQLSEGMKQRVGIARCLVNSSEILLMDEPFGALDYLTRLKMQELMLNLWKKKKLTILFVTHDIDEAIKMSNRIIILGDRPSKIKGILTVKPPHHLLKKKILKLINEDEVRSKR